MDKNKNKMKKKTRNEQAKHHKNTKMKIKINKQKLDQTKKIPKQSNMRENIYKNMIGFILCRPTTVGYEAYFEVLETPCVKCN